MRNRSKTVATWLALTLGSFGIHRFYLHGRRDIWAWLHPWPTLLGLVGAQRMRTLGIDDHTAWALIPILGLMLSQAMLCAIVYGLTPDEKWALRWRQPLRETRWAPILGVVAALLIGGAVLMGTLAFGGQMYFEYQAEQR